jgi:hypothetical protein
MFETGLFFSKNRVSFAGIPNYYLCWVGCTRCSVQSAQIHVRLAYLFLNVQIMLTVVNIFCVSKNALVFSNMINNLLIELVRAGQ